MLSASANSISISSFFASSNSTSITSLEYYCQREQHQKGKWPLVNIGFKLAYNFVPRFFNSITVGSVQRVWARRNDRAALFTKYKSILGNAIPNQSREVGGWRESSFCSRRRSQVMRTVKSRIMAPMMKRKKPTTMVTIGLRLVMANCLPTFSKMRIRPARHSSRPRAIKMQKGLLYFFIETPFSLG